MTPAVLPDRPDLPPPGLVAILRGLTPAEAPAVGDVLVEAGFRHLEVPLNSPDPLTSIGLLAERLPAEVVVGAGTVLTAAQVDAVHDAGGRLVVSPHADPAVIARTADRGMLSCPGVATPTEAFAALAAGAHALKLFPAPQVGIGGMRAWAAVLPPGTAMLPVGGIDAETLPPWLAAGAAGAGIGTSLYTPGRGPDELAPLAAALVAAWDAHRPTPHPEATA